MIEVTWEDSFSQEADTIELVDDQGNTIYTTELPE